jgi:L-serine dehydratase
MRAARMFVQSLDKDGLLAQTAGVKAELYGSLGATGKGHSSDVGVLLGLMGETPDGVDIAAVPGMVAQVREQQSLTLNGTHPVPFVEKEHLLFYRREALPEHPNGMRFSAFSSNGALLREAKYLSVGGGFVVTAGAANTKVLTEFEKVALPFHSGAELLAHCEQQRISISQVMMRNEQSWRCEAEVRTGLLNIWRVMRECVQRGCSTEGVLPGPFKVPRRAHKLQRDLTAKAERALADPLSVMDWVNVYAIAVNEENAAGGRVVTAPTNGAAGIIPAVLHYYDRFVFRGNANENDDKVVEFLLTAAAIGILYKLNASISGAEVGCQGEVGVACSMAAGALAAVLGGTPAQVENAAEIGMEHNLGLTCDPIGGLVQVPCIERNAMGSVKAVNAARMALQGDGTHVVSLDNVIKTMRETGADMKTKYKETARGGLAVSIVEC